MFNVQSWCVIWFIKKKRSRNDRLFGSFISYFVGRVMSNRKSQWFSSKFGFQNKYSHFRADEQLRTFEWFYFFPLSVLAFDSDRFIVTVIVHLNVEQVTAKIVPFDVKIKFNERFMLIQIQRNRSIAKATCGMVNTALKIIKINILVAKLCEICESWIARDR